MDDKRTNNLIVFMNISDEMERKRIEAVQGKVIHVHCDLIKMFRKMISNLFTLGIFI